MLDDDAEVGTLVRGPEATTGEPDSFERRDYYFTTQVTLAGLLATAGRRVNLHAGCVANDAGRVLVVVGPSGTGKTTATRALAARLHYLSDETASITPDGVVFPHPKPLSIVVRPDDHTHKEQLSPDDIGLGSTPESGSLHRIVVLHRGVPDRHGLQPLDTTTALMELIEQSSSLASLDAPLTTLLDVMDATGGVLALEYDEIADHVDELIGLLDEVTEPAAKPEARPEPVRHPGVAGGSAARRGHGDTRLHRLPWADAVELGADLVVLLEPVPSAVGARRHRVAAPRRAAHGPRSSRRGHRRSTAPTPTRPRSWSRLWTHWSERVWSSGVRCHDAGVNVLAFVLVPVAVAVVLFVSGWAKVGDVTGTRLAFVAMKVPAVLTRASFVRALPFAELLSAARSC